MVGNDAGNVVLRTRAFISEPFQTQFVDLPSAQTVTGLDAPVNGVRMWNPSVLDVYTGYTTPADVPSMLFGRGDIQGQKSPLVTVGLQGVHPIVDQRRRRADGEDRGRTSASRATPTGA